MLKHMLNTNGNVGNRATRQDNSIVMEPRYDRSNQRFRSPATNGLRVHYPLNASQLSHVSNVDASKHSIIGNSFVTTENKTLNGGLNISRVSTTKPNNSHPSSDNSSKYRTKQLGVKELLISLGLLCLVSLLLALLSLIFLLKISPVTANDIRELLRAEQLTLITAEEYVVVYEVTLALCALTLSLNLCCLLVCAIQFLFAVKLVKSRHGGNERTNKYLRKSSISRVCAVGGFFISIPVFLTGIILYTFIQFHSTPAIVTSVFIGLGIIFCGCAMVHNVFIWQKEKTNAVKEMALQQSEQTTTQNNIFFNNIVPLNQSHITTHQPSILQSTLQIHPSNGPYTLRPAATPSHVENINLTSHRQEASGSISPGIPTATIDLSSVGTTNSPHELSTLV
ncbi:uncharacterized protein LOC108740516 [Agrilus planipennis]|uniref:Uncharacterized protein LOC108740516 n=1 Tax=Agrilus planipennis TaxID=224129 RepID=A0A1W4X2K8_AGRPL|nr:uncharacterized protein LOC108740516 [Agrilus planipennis]